MSNRVRAVLAICLIAFGLSIGAGLTVAQSATQFQTEQDAQAHCPKDTVVWVNLSTGVYHYPGQRWYGNTKNGAFMCEKEAKAVGDRATRNGQ